MFGSDVIVTITVTVGSPGDRNTEGIEQAGTAS
jgi:hypothetical protein